MIKSLALTDQASCKQPDLGNKLIIVMETSISLRIKKFSLACLLITTKYQLVFSPTLSSRPRVPDSRTKCSCHLSIKIEKKYKEQNAFLDIAHSFDLFQYIFYFVAIILIRWNFKCLSFQKKQLVWIAEHMYYHKDPRGEEQQDSLGNPWV